MTKGADIEKKKEHIEHMFNNIAPHYDFLNHFLSLGIDRYWRYKAANILKSHAPARILDVASGTGDFAIAVARRLHPESITGYDISEQMLRIGREKVQKKGLEGIISFRQGASEDMPFEDAAFDAVTVAFGVRNFERLDLGLKEFERVLSKNGVAVILEFSRPRIFPVRQLYALYSHYMVPWLGRLFSRDASAYRYLPQSVEAFPDGADFMAKLTQAGFGGVAQKRLTFGIVTIYIAEK
ncbi:MAG: bifunctional demethylmenaquinone methyltransferase/2-methoxy-6-polyprenyl-1,4-benzoquinol methylase UbiE [Bacteroidales bacterium]|jgi:demethylmenaquinone methyltransferase/2-methoxy-6-polyprenyl-1,4-benzoquinol methylase|nr:bifunctional demethylmenaquinone methyltransferase/2-methoxy-6-polyprenyl-1,4-benzoquinol methylase UbiE [Bacteroidales bacterium]